MLEVWEQGRGEKWQEMCYCHFSMWLLYSKLIMFKEDLIIFRFERIQEICFKEKMLPIYIYIYIYISNIQSASVNNGWGLFAYWIFEEFHINLRECLMYGYCYIYPIQVYIIKLTYRMYTMQLEENSNLVKLSLLIYFGQEYHYTLHLIRCLHTANMNYSLYIYVWKNLYKFKFSGESKGS